MSKQAPGAGAAGPLLQIEGLHKKFGELDVLRGVDMQVQRGERVSIIGAVSFILAEAFGLFVALCRISQNGLIRKTATVFIDFARGLPIVVILYIVCFVRPRPWPTLSFPRRPDRASAGWKLCDWPLDGYVPLHADRGQ